MWFSGFLFLILSLIVEVYLWWKLQASLIFLSGRTCTIGGWLNTFLPHCIYVYIIYIFINYCLCLLTNICWFRIKRVCLYSGVLIQSRESLRVCLWRDRLRSRHGQMFRGALWWSLWTLLWVGSNNSCRGKVSSDNTQTLLFTHVQVLNNVADITDFTQTCLSCSAPVKTSFTLFWLAFY